MLLRVRASGSLAGDAGPSVLEAGARPLELTLAYECGAAGSEVSSVVTVVIYLSALLQVPPAPLLVLVPVLVRVLMSSSCRTRAASRRRARRRPRRGGRTP